MTDRRIKEQLYRLAVVQRSSDPIGAMNRWWKGFPIWSKTITNWEDRLFGKVIS